MKYVLHSKLNKGFWSNECGWVKDIKSATRFDNDYVKMWPNASIINDNEWIVVNYNE